ncbi:hypothetical protein OEZ85_008627 [Tetradesmus obliquus]|uniref:Uncharacterized protein n=1 Tax=Tetradesmus obliquus TaxID=3088 RepID=A0ABY8TJD7_TETOB|nr:hypothetical protein OEZ85_008627 [Tetradesmus obliquus]
MAAKLRWGSAILLALCVVGWTIALGGLGSINWLVCSNTEKTLQDIQDNAADNWNITTAGELAITVNMFSGMLRIPQQGSVAASEVAVCSRPWRWEWFALFFQFAIIASALVVTLMPTRLLRSRFPLAIMFAIATAIVMVAVNNDINDVWMFWDTHKLFSQWAGVLRQLYMSAAALVAGWILVIIFNLVWIGFALDFEEPATKDAAAPITGDVENAATRK